MYIDGKWVDVKPSQREGNVGKGGRSSAKIGPKGKYIKLVGSRNCLVGGSRMNTGSVFRAGGSSLEQGSSITVDLQGMLTDELSL